MSGPMTIVEQLCALAADDAVDAILNLESQADTARGKAIFVEGARCFAGRSAQKLTQGDVEWTSA